MKFDHTKKLDKYTYLHEIKEVNLDVDLGPQPTLIDIFSDWLDNMPAEKKDKWQTKLSECFNLPSKKKMEVINLLVTTFIKEKMPDSIDLELEDLRKTFYNVILNSMRSNNTSTAKAGFKRHSFFKSDSLPPRQEEPSIEQTLPRYPT